MNNEYWGGLLPTYTGSRFLVERSITLEVVKCRIGRQGVSHILTSAPRTLTCSRFVQLKWTSDAPKYLNSAVRTINLAQMILRSGSLSILL